MSGLKKKKKHREQLSKIFLKSGSILEDKKVKKHPKL